MSGCAALQHRCTAEPIRMVIIRTSYRYLYLVLDRSMIAVLSVLRVQALMRFLQGLWFIRSSRDLEPAVKLIGNINVDVLLVFF